MTTQELNYVLSNFVTNGVRQLSRAYPSLGLADTSEPQELQCFPSKAPSTQSAPRWRRRPVHWSMLALIVSSWLLLPSRPKTNHLQYLVVTTESEQSEQLVSMLLPHVTQNMFSVDELSIEDHDLFLCVFVNKNVFTDRGSVSLFTGIDSCTARACLAWAFISPRSPRGTRCGRGCGCHCPNESPVYPKRKSQRASTHLM